MVAAYPLLLSVFYITNIYVHLRVATRSIIYHNVVMNERSQQSDCHNGMKSELTKLTIYVPLDTKQLISTQPISWASTEENHTVMPTKIKSLKVTRTFTDSSSNDNTNS